MIISNKQFVCKQLHSNLKNVEGNSIGKHLFRVNNKSARTRSIDFALTSNNLVEVGDWQLYAEPFKKLFFWDI